MKIFFYKFRVIAVVILLFAFSGKIEAQCAVTGNVNTNTMPCSSYTGCTSISIGNGTTPTNLNFNADLDLTCLGAIQFIVTNQASVNFGSSDRLYLGAGSSIVIQTGGDLSGASCNASERIYIGGVLYASCNGNGGATATFSDIETFGGSGGITSNSPVCNGNSINLSATPPPNGNPFTYTWFEPSVSTTVSIGTGQNVSITATSSGTHTYQVKMYSASLNKTMIMNCAVVVNSGATTAAPTVTTTQPTCAVATGTINVTAPTGMNYSIDGLTYTNTSGIFSSVAPGTYSVTAKNSSGCISNATSATINAQPATPGAPTGSSSQFFCSGATIASLAATGTAIQWYAASSGGSALATNTTLINGTHYYASQTIGCESSSRFDVSVTISNPVDWANLQWPPSSNICEGGSLTAYGQVYQAGVTPGNGLQGSGIIVEFGYAVSNTNPNTWTNWYAASFNAFGGGDNNDEYQYTFTPPSIGIYYYTFRYRSGICNWQYGGHVLNAGGFWDGTTNVSGVLTVNSIPSAPSVTTVQPTCATPTATITITQVGGETYSFDGGPYSGTLVYSGLIQGSIHTIIAKSASGCISPVANITINTTTKTWNGSWSPSAPTSADNIIFAGGVFSSTTDLTACSCQVNNSASVVMNSGHILTLTNGLTVIGFGEITFKDKASLVQINSVANSGDITYERKTNTVVRSTDYTYWSSPVSPQTIGDFSPDTPDGMMYSFDSSIDDWKQESLTSSMNVGIGYIIRGPEPSGIPIPPAQFTANFVGVPNNGNYSISGISADKSYLLGNPYPSALDADSFLNANAGVLDGTLYFWTHNTQIGTGVNDPGSGYYAYSGNDYASYNSVGGVGVAAISGGAIPTGKIGSGQGFFASTKVSLSGSSIDFNNSMRVGVGGIAGNNSQFFKKRNPKTEKIIEKHRIWLNLTNTQGAFKQTLIGYVTDATNDYDGRFDGESFDGNEFVDFYSVNQDKNLVIQGRGLPFDENDEVPLGYRTTINGDFTINIDQTDGLLTNQAVYIEDKLANTVFDLKSGAYTFNTVAGTFNDRFVLRYTNKTLATKNFDSLENKVLVSTKNKQIIINSFAETIDKVTVYDLLGRQVYQKVNVNNNELSIANLALSHQALVIKTTLQNGETITNKIIY